MDEKDKIIQTNDGFLKEIEKKVLSEMPEAEELLKIIEEEEKETDEEE